MRIFEISNGKVVPCATVAKLKLSNGVEIPAILVGEEGRGRKLGVLPVTLLPHSYKEWKEKGETRINGAVIGSTQKGAPKLVQSLEAELPQDECIVVFMTNFGFRGSNEHTGDQTEGGYLPFPGRVLTAGTIADGIAGRMASGEQLVAVMPRGVVFRTGYSGRLYGAPSEHFYMFDGRQITALTREEREISDLF